MADPPPISSGTVERLWRWAVIVLGILAAAAAAKAGAVVALPLVAALLLAGMFWEMRDWIRRWAPAWVAALLCSIVIVIGALLIIGWGVHAGMSGMDQFQQSREKYLTEYERLRSTLVGIGVPKDSLPALNRDETPWIAGDSLLGTKSRRTLTRTVTGGLRSAAGVIAALLLMLALVFFIFLEADEWVQWGREHLPRRQGHAIHRFSLTVAGKTRRYFLGKTISGVISGGATWLWLMAMGVPMAFTWGVFTLLMNYIPNVGALLSGIPASLLAIVELGWTNGLVVAGGLVAIETMVGNLVDPYVQGNLLDLSSFVVLASLVFWGWMWGIAGAVLAPILTATIVTGVHHLHASLEPRRPGDEPPD